PLHAEFSVLRVVESQHANQPTSVLSRPLDPSIIMYVNVRVQQHLFWIWEPLLALGRIATGAAIQEIVVGQRLVRIIGDRLKMIDVKHPFYQAPLLTHQAIYATEREFVPQPGPKARDGRVTLRPVPPNVRLNGVREGVHTSLVGIVAASFL